MTREQRAEALEIVTNRMIAAQSSIDANLRPGDREAARREREICWILKLLLEDHARAVPPPNTNRWEK